MGFFGDVFDTVFDKTLDVVGDAVEVVATTAIDKAIEAKDSGVPGVSAVAGKVAAGVFDVDLDEVVERDKSNDSAIYAAAGAGWDLVDKIVSERVKK